MRLRSHQGMSLIEMLTALFLTSFISMAICEMAVTQNFVAFRTNSKLESLVSAKRFLSYFQRDVRMARAFGLSTVSPQYGVITSDQNHLIIYEPVFDQSSALPSTTGQKWSTSRYVYSVIPDPDSGNRPNQYQLVRLDPADNALVLVTGLVGPFNSTSILPVIFQYFYKTPDGVMLGTSPPRSAAELAQVVGVRLSIEVVGALTSRSELNSKSFAFSTDVLSRANVGAP